MNFQFGLLAHKPKKWQKFFFLINSLKKTFIDIIFLLKYLKSTDQKVVTCRVLFYLDKN